MLSRVLGKRRVRGANGLLYFWVSVCTAFLTLPPMLAAEDAPEVGRLENEQLSVSVRADGRFDVRDLRNNRLYVQPSPSVGPVEVLAAPPARFSPDGDLAEWTGKPYGVSPNMLTVGKVESEADCSAGFYIGSRDGKLCIAVRVRDDVVDFGPVQHPWEQDSIEFWLDDQQYNLTLVGKDSVLRQMTKGARRVDDWRGVLRAAEEGYVAEIEMPKAVGPHGFRFALGVNDSDGGAKRQGQIFWPSGYEHSLLSSAAEFRRPGMAPALPRIRRTDRTVELSSLTFMGLDATIKLALDKDTLAVELAIDPAADMSADIEYPYPFLFDAPRGVWVLPHQGGGLAYRIRGDNLPWASWGCCMPTFVAVDPDGRGGVLAVLETQFDALLREAWLPDKLRSVSVAWHPTMGKFGYARRMRFHFLPGGTLMDAVRRYRSYSESRGMWVGFETKAAKRPQIAQLMGAVQLYGPSADVCTALHQLGVRRAIATIAPAAVEKLGFLAFRYDLYTDVYDPAGAEGWPGHPSTWERCMGFRFPQDIVKNRDGSPMRGGPDIANPKTGEVARCYRPCQQVAFEVLRRDHRLTTEIRNQGYKACFMDVLSAAKLWECYDPAHLCSRVEDAHWRRRQFEYLTGLGAVVGTEGGRDYCMPYADWSMNTGGPATYGFFPPGMGDMLNVPMDANGRHYSEVTFSFTRRAPIFTLVYHGAYGSSYWWGDNPCRTPELWWKRDLVNLLMDTMETYRFHDEYGTTFFWLNMERLVESCKLLGTWGEAVGYDRIADYVVLDEAGSAARTTYEGGLSVAVNLGESPVRTPEGADLPPHAYLITGSSRRMPSLPVGRPVVVAPGWTPLDGEFEIAATGHLTGWSAPPGIRLEADRKNLRPDERLESYMKRTAWKGPDSPMASARICGEPDKSGVVLTSRPFLVLGGWTYSLGAWVRAETPCRVTFAFEPENEGGAALAEPVAAESSWRQVNWAAVVPHKATHARLVVRATGVTGPVTLNVDDFSVRASRPVPPLALPHCFGFDTDVMGWTAANGIKRMVTAEGAHAGGGCLRVAGESKSGWSLASSQQFSLPPGARIRLSAWMRVERYDPAVKPPYLKCGFSRALGGFLGNEATSRYDMTRPGTWQRLEGVFSAPSEPARCYLGLEKGGAHAVAAELYLDDVTIEQLQ